VKFENKNIRINWNHPKNIHKMPEQHTWKARRREKCTATILGTAHVLGKVVMSKWEIFEMRNTIKCTICCNQGIAAKISLYLEI